MNDLFYVETKDKEIVNSNFKLLDPKLDVVFHALFNETENILTESLISDILGEKIKIKERLDRFLPNDFADEKTNILDLRVLLEDNTLCSIEIQLINLGYNDVRFSQYIAKLFSSQLKRGESYYEVKKTITILILNYTIPEMNNIFKFDSKWHLSNDDTHMVLTNKLELVILELPKAKKIYSKSPDDKACQWMMFLNNPDSEEVKHIMSINENIKRAYEKLKCISNDEKTIRMAELRERAIKDEKTAIAYATKKGVEQGKEQATINTAKKMLKEKIDIDTISKITELTKNEILKMK